MGSSEPALSQDVVFDILSSPRRRYVLYHLRETDEPVDLTALAEQVAAWENETDLEDLTEQERKRVYVSLYQTHIPRLDEAGVVEYHKDSGKVALAADARDIDEYLISSEDQFSWQRIYLALAAISGVLLALMVLNIAFFAMVPESVLAGLIILAFGVTAIVQTVVRVQSRRSIPSELRERM